MRIIACCLLLWVSSELVWAGGSLQGTVRDSRGDPIKGAEIRIEGRNGNLGIQSDAKGHYFFDGLATGTDYRVTLIVSGSVKASIQNVRAVAEKPLNSASICDPRTGSQINIWSGSRTNPRGPILAQAIGKKWMKWPYQRYQQ